MAKLEMNLSEQNEQLIRIISSLTQTIDNLQKALSEQRETNAKLLETIAELQEQLNNRFPVCRTIEVRQSDYHSFAGVLEDA